MLRPHPYPQMHRTFDQHSVNRQQHKPGADLQITLGHIMTSRTIEAAEGLNSLREQVQISSTIFEEFSLVCGC